MLIVFLNNLFFAKPYVHWGNEQSLSIHMGLTKSSASVLSYWPSLPSANGRCLGYAHLEGWSLPGEKQNVRSGSAPSLCFPPRSQRTSRVMFLFAFSFFKSRSRVYSPVLAVTEKLRCRTASAGGPISDRPARQRHCGRSTYALGLTQ